MKPEFVAAEHAAEMLGLNSSAVLRLIKAGVLEAVLVGSRRYIPIPELRKVVIERCGVHDSSFGLERLNNSLSRVPRYHFGTEK